MSSITAETKQAESLVGTTLDGRFELLALAGTGGMGHVYRARDRQTGGDVAIKTIPPDHGDVARFARETELLAAIDHPGVVRYLAHGLAASGTPYLAMEWLAGEDLAARLHDAPLSVGDTSTLVIRAAEALSAAHARGIVHRDLKPANLFLVDGEVDRLKLIDFGIARPLGDNGLTVTGMLVGTPAYMAPEQVRGGDVDPRADVYALGAVMFACLTGHPPFRGDHQLAVLAKVVLEPPPPIRDVRPDVPAELERLITSMLAKDPAHRPADAAAVVAAVQGLGEASAVSVRRVRAAVSVREHRVACVVLCAGSDSRETATVTEMSAGGATQDVVRSAIEQRGGAIAALAKGAWVVTIPNAASPAEHASRAARCALALARIRTSFPVFVATGRVLVSGEQRVGEVIDRAADALVAALGRPGENGVWVDAATAELLEGRFDISSEGDWRALAGERDAVAPVRTLLGKPAKCVGRDQQLAMLSAMLVSCSDESRACAALVTAPPGLGKTHLVHELLRTTVASKPDVDVLSAGGDPIRMSSPLAIVAQITKRAAGIVDADGAVERHTKLAALVARDFAVERTAWGGEILGEICDAAAPQANASPALRAARADVSIMADAVRQVWAEWLAGRATRGTVLLLVEDVHWADAASVRLLEATLSALEDRPVFLLATGRPEAASLFSDRFRERGFVALTLAPLSQHASERLVRNALGDGVDDTLVRALAKRAGGHPFHLEELVRASAEGRGADALPDSVLGMVQARLDDLGPQARRLLRAASVYGETFRPDGVAALMGDDAPERDVRAALRRLVEQEVITEERSTRATGASRYRFRHALFRDSAYAMLADGDRVTAHHRAAAWLEETGESDPVVLAEHYDRGAVADKALGYFRRAAAQALHRNDLERAMGHAQRARALGAAGSEGARLSAIEAEVLYWRGDLTTAGLRASDAVGALDPGAAEWFDAVAVAIGSDGQRGRNDEVARWLDETARAPSSVESRGAQVVALCRGMAQLLWAHHDGDIAEVRARLDSLVDRPEPLDAFQLGWVHRVRGESAWLHERNVDRCLTELDASCAAFERAQALRALSLTRLNTATLCGWSGEPERGLELVAKARVDADRLGASFLSTYALAVEGVLCAFSGDPIAERRMREALPGVAASPRLAFLCHVIAGSLALERGDVDAADADAQRATALTVVEVLRPAGLALAARVALARGHRPLALDLASDGERIESTSRDLELLHGMAGAALAEVHLASGDRDAAQNAIGGVVTRLSAIARTIVSPEGRRRYWGRRLSNARIVEIARELGVDESND